MRRKYFERDFYEVVALLTQGKGKEQTAKRVAVRFTDPLQAAAKMKEFGAGAKCIHHKEQVMTEELSISMLVGSTGPQGVSEVDQLKDLMAKVLGAEGSPKDQLDAMTAGAGRKR